MTSFAVVGSGWRAEMFWRLAAALPDVECVGAVVRTPRDLPVPTFSSLAEVRPDFVVTAVPWAANPAVIVEAVERGLPVLAETPPAPGADGLPSSGGVPAAPGWSRWPSSTCWCRPTRRAWPRSEPG